jgi:hypothetical protein
MLAASSSVRQKRGAGASGRLRTFLTASRERALPLAFVPFATRALRNLGASAATSSKQFEKKLWRVNICSGSPWGPGYR